MTASEAPRYGVIPLLRTQRELVSHHNALETKILLYRGGYRSGKTVGLVAKALDLGARCWPHPILAMEPTYPMVRDVFVKTALYWMRKWGFDPHWYVSKKTLVVRGRWPIEILCRSADAREAVEGLTVGALIADEWELYDIDILKTAMARVSVGKPETQQIVLGGTPEGFGKGYELVEKNPKPTTKIITARTTDNRYLRADYVEDMRSRFSDEEASEKLDGERSAPAGRTYTRFHPGEHCEGQPAVSGGRLQFFAGFDTDVMVWAAVLVGQNSNTFHVVGEVVGHRTDSIRQATRAREWVIDYEARHGRRIGHEDVRRMSIPVVCDPNVIGVSTTGGVALSHIKILQDAGFKPLYARKNARYEDRVASLQKLLTNRMITFDKEAAEYTVRCVAHSKRYNGRPDAKGGLLQGELALTCGIMWHAPAFKPATAHIEERRERDWNITKSRPPKTRAEAIASLPDRLQARLAAASPGGRAGHAVTDLGCTIPEFVDVIERQWSSGMAWENWGTHGWQLDHRRPLASYDLTNREQCKAALHFSNYQPLWAEDNRAKGVKWAAPTL